MPHPSEGRVFSNIPRPGEHRHPVPLQAVQPPSMDGRSVYNVPPPPHSREVLTLDQTVPKPVYEEGPLVTELYLSECNIEVRVGKYGNYFLLVNHKNPEKTLRLYKPAMMKLLKELPEAFNVAQVMEVENYPDDSSYTVASIYKRNNSDICLYISMYQGKAYVYVRLFVEKEDGSYLPSTYGVQISNMDNIQTITNFVNKNK